MENEKRFELSPEVTGLVIVDMQVEGCERHGPGVKPVIDQIRSMLDRFREAKGKIVHVQSVRTQGPSRIHGFWAALWLAVGKFRS